jgi:hypothetical protein
LSSPYPSHRVSAGHFQASKKKKKKKKKIERKRKREEEKEEQKKSRKYNVNAYNEKPTNKPVTLNKNLWTQTGGHVANSLPASAEHESFLM